MWLFIFTVILEADVSLKILSLYRANTCTKPLSSTLVSHSEYLNVNKPLQEKLALLAHENVVPLLQLLHLCSLYVEVL